MKASEKYWDKHSDSMTGYSRDYLPLARLVSLEAKIEELEGIEIKLTGNEEIYYWISESLKEYRAELSQLEKELNL